MKSLRRLLTRIVNSFYGREHDERLREEIEEHIALRTEENLRTGLSPVEARRQAIVKFGGIESVRETYRAERGLRWIETTVHDLRYALRLLRKSPGFTFAAVGTLALAIGANTVVFGVLNAMILRPLNVPHGESLYAIERASDRSTLESYPNYLELRDRNRSFDGLAAFDIAQVGLDTGKGPAFAWVLEASGNYFDVLGIQPHLGRFFHSSDEHGANSAPYIVLSYAYWHTEFQGDRAAVGRIVQLNNHPFTIIGVAPPDFQGTLLFAHPHFYVPMVNQEQVLGVNNLNDRGVRGIFMAIGHLRPDVTPAQAISDLNAIGTQLEKSYPKDAAHMSFILTRPGLFGDYIGRPVKQFLSGLMLLAGLILLAACANMGSLFGARAADHSREIALRLALGSSRTRILRQLFTESLLISLIGGVLGLLCSVLLLRALSVWRPLPGFPGYVPVYPDAKVYAIALLLALASGFLFGAVPVRQILRTNPYEVIKLGSTGKIGRRVTGRDLLLGAQIALCAVLVTSSMVAVRGLMRSLHSNFGFDPNNAMIVTTDLIMAGYRGDRVPEMQRRMLDAVKAIPGVQSVGLIDDLPLDNQNNVPVFTDASSELKQANAAIPDVNMCNISPEYFQAAGTALLAGRSLTWHDDKNAPRVAVINREFARRIFGSVNKSIGSYYKTREGARIQVVGVVEDGKYTTLTEEPQAAMFLPILQSPASQMNLVVRAESDPQQLAGTIRNTLQKLDAGLPLGIGTWKEDLQGAPMFPARVATVALGVMGLMGAMLAVTGIFGMAAYSVSKRLRELGIRIALGAQRRGVLQAALGRPFKLLAWGSATGLLLGILATRILAVIVYQAAPRDPLVLVAVVLAMSVLGLIATWIPARRALSIDPLILLREE